MSPTTRERFIACLTALGHVACDMVDEINHPIKLSKSSRFNVAEPTFEPSEIDEAEAIARLENRGFTVHKGGKK